MKSTLLNVFFYITHYDIKKVSFPRNYLRKVFSEDFNFDNSSSILNNYWSHCGIALTGTFLQPQNGLKSKKRKIFIISNSCYIKRSRYFLSARIASASASISPFFLACLLPSFLPTLNLNFITYTYLTVVSSLKYNIR